MTFVAIILKISTYYYKNTVLDTATRLDIYTYTIQIIQMQDTDTDTEL